MIRDFIFNFFLGLFFITCSSVFLIFFGILNFFRISFRSVVGAMYVREYFDESSRQSINEMVKDIRSVFIEMIDELDWMDDQTRLRAKEKATAMTTHIAYPVELLDDKKLTELYENVFMTILHIFQTNNVKTIFFFNSIVDP